MKNISNGNNKYPVQNKTSEFISSSGIKVKVSYPDHVPEIIRKQKINRMYEILSGENGQVEQNS